jgi:kynurenine formamidase
MPEGRKLLLPALLLLISSSLFPPDLFSAPAKAAEARRPPIDLQGVRVVDLTYAFDEKTLYWPTSPTTFKLDRLAYGKTEGGYFYASNSFCAPEHGGTHLDAPIHFAAGKRTVDQIPAEQLIGAAVVIDVAAKAAADADYRLTLEDVRAWETAHGAIPPGAIVLLRTGWGARWPDRKHYLGDDKPGDASNLHFPSYGAEAARFLVEQRKVGALGVDTASIDHGPSKDFIVHQIATGANVPGLENVAHLEEVPPTGAWVIALPMKIAGGSGGPVRIVALVPES